jgi:1,4-dihydroxy-2-naphthoate octaprenyltransferase|tara:strand:+ start:875 stop:1861 length:987 start_codon:yes stop_codon:yes gene_type:complete
LKLGVWAKELRIPFLSLPVIFVPLGIMVALSDGFFNLNYGILTLIGVVSLHASVNVLNDYFDYKSGIDTTTTPTPFSGGSRVLPEKLLTPNAVLIGGVVLLLIGSSIGLYFLNIFNFDRILLGIILISVFSVILYSPLLSKFALGELFVFLNFGPLLFTGIYFIQSGGLINIEAIIVGSIVGLMTTGILYINQFPDTVADKSKGRLHIVARLGKKRAVNLYNYMMGASYVIIIVSVITPFIIGIGIPLTCIIALLTFSLTPKGNFRTASKILGKDYEKIMELIPAMGNTVMTTLQTSILLLIGYIIWWTLSMYFPGTISLVPIASPVA